MIDDVPDLDRRYRAPRAFGPLPGPRNIPYSQRDLAGAPDEVTTSLAVSLEADPAELSRLLPDHTRLSGPAVLTVTVTMFENLRWLAGRGYPIVTVTFPIEYVGESAAGPGTVGRYLPVLWEGLADPVITGREELAFPKLYAKIRAARVEDVSPGGSADADASWDGFRFFDLSVDDLHDVPAGPPAPPLGTIVHRYIPSLAFPGRADIDQLLHHGRSAAEASASNVTHRLSGVGRFTFHQARFADAPVQFTVINTLAALTLSPTGPATLTRITQTPGKAPGGVPPRLLRDALAPQPVEVSS